MRKILIPILGSLLMTISTIATAQVETEITIRVIDINKNKRGNIIVMVFGKKGYPKIHSKALMTQTKSVNQNEMTFKYLIKTSEKALAVKVLHDENKDGKVTKNWTGIYPKEGLGFSNKQKINLLGPPNFSQSKLPIEQLNAGITISVQYPKREKI